MKKIFTVVLCICVILGVTACSETKNNNVEEMQVEKSLEDLGITKQKVDVTIVDVAENKDVEKTLELDNPSTENIAKNIMKELGCTGEEINSVTEKDNSVYVDFSKDSKFLKSGTAGETAVLDSLGLTFIGNLKYSHIYFSIDGKEYESGHIYLDLTEPYM